MYNRPDVVRDHSLMMSELRGREGVQEIRTLVMRASTQNSDMGEGGGPKTGRKFGHHLWMVPNSMLQLAMQH